MLKLIVEKLPRITKNRKKLEKKLGIEIKNQGKEVFINGNPENEYAAEKVIEALDFGFPFSVALMIKEHDYLFEIINIKDYTHKKDMERIRARIIGKKGKTLRIFEELTKCFFELKDNQVGIIGDPEYIKNAQDAVISIIRGAKQANVYSYLEKHQVKPVYDLGLKKRVKKRKNL
jgi:ribosomal RNA assembly protein